MSFGSGASSETDADYARGSLVVWVIVELRCVCFFTFAGWRVVDVWRKLPIAIMSHSGSDTLSDGTIST